MFEITPIDWSFHIIEPDPRPKWIAAIIILSLILIGYTCTMIVCYCYLWRRRHNIKHYYKVHITYLDDKTKEVLYFITYGTIDIYMYFNYLACCKIKRIKDRDLDKYDDVRFYDLSIMVEEKKRLMAEYRKNEKKIYKNRLKRLRGKRNANVRAIRRTIRRIFGKS